MFDWLDRLIAEHGDWLYPVFVWVSFLVMAWIIGGGLRRRTALRRWRVIQPTDASRPSVRPSPLPTTTDKGPDDDGRSFAA